MLDFPRWKIWAVSLTVAIGILFAIPSLIAGTPLKDKWPGWLPSATISLGLDLSGGSQLLLEADTLDAAKQRLAAMEDTVSTELRRANPRIEIGQNMRVRVVKATLSHVVTKSTKPAND